jgi:preprotein translocase subunit YajC
MILAATGKSSGGGSYLFLIVIIAVLVLMYFVTVRPQRRRQQRAMQTQREIRPGQRVRTTAGMYATIVALEGDDVILEVAPGVETRFLRRVILEVLPDGGTGSAGPGQAADFASPSEYASGEGEGPAGEAGGSSHATPEATGGESTTVADTPSETETTDEAGTPRTA